MGEHYEHLSLEERCQIAQLRGEGRSIRQIAAAVDRPPSTISRELKRNSGAQLGYKPGYAEEQARARRWTGSRLERDDALRTLVLGCLACGWSPEQVAGRLARQRGAPVISHESIYRFIYAQLRRTNQGSWRHYLPRAKFKRGRRARKGGSPARFIQDRVSIAQRPNSAQHRHAPGHWEADLMLFATYGQAILVAHERKSRILLLAKQPSKAAQPTVQQLLAWLEPLPDTLRQTITFDNGTEFALHHQLNTQLGMQTFFCDTHSPWQKGGIENAIGRMRSPLPRKTNLAGLDAETLNTSVAAYNNTPRKCLGFQSPAEAFLSQLLHFKRESISRPSPG
jgi:IS30 family transposase